MCERLSATCPTPLAAPNLARGTENEIIVKAHEKRKEVQIDGATLRLCVFVGLGESLGAVAMKARAGMSTCAHLKNGVRALGEQTSLTGAQRSRRSAYQEPESDW